MVPERTGDLILAQGSYAFVQDGSSGQVFVIVGPTKASLADNEKTVVYDPAVRTFSQVSQVAAIRNFITAEEGQYIVLINPAKIGENNKEREHPREKEKNNQAVPELNFGHRTVINGPATFALYPGQVADVVDGHRLRSNEYLIARVYNADLAKQNIKTTRVEVVEGSAETKTDIIPVGDIKTGSLHVIKGTDVSFFVPPTGIEVVETSPGKYVRNALTLETLEYCILLDQSGDKTYERGPKVVFPKPTQTFIEKDGSARFRALELNDNMGIYIKVISDYTEGTDAAAKVHKAGEELFITGKEQRIYFPRAEHSIISYGTQIMHYAVALPKGDARYVLDKNNGQVGIVEGPKMLMPDPREEVIVRRILDERTVRLWFPGNDEALAYNRDLLGVDVDATEASRGFANSMLYSKRVKSANKGGVLGASSMDFMDVGSTDEKRLSNYVSADEMTRGTSYTKPRAITINNKYEGVVSINVWPGYAVQTVRKDGSRRVVQGPKAINLEFDETLEVLGMSTGKPKTDNNLFHTTYLQIANNIVSDVVKVETGDSVYVDVRVSYRVNFIGDEKKWFGVSNYVKLLTQHMRSVIRNLAKRYSVEEFTRNLADLIRDTVLGEVVEGKRPGRKFEENDMNIYDVEVLDYVIGDAKIKSLIDDSQHETVRLNLEVAGAERRTAARVKQHDLKIRELEAEHSVETKEATMEFELEEIGSKRDDVRRQNEVAAQEALDKIAERERERKKLLGELDNAIKSASVSIDVDAMVKRMNAIQPQLLEAISTAGEVATLEVLAKNLKPQVNGLGALLSSKGGVTELMETVKGSPLEQIFDKLFKTKNGSTN